MATNTQHKPQTAGELVIEDPNTLQRIADYADGLRTGHMLMHGPRGTGKSATADVIAKSRIDPDYLPFFKPYEGSKMSCSDVEGILKDWNWQRLGGECPVTVINEIDLLAPATLERLKSFMDEYGHLGQIVATTNNQHKLSAPLRDRFDIIEMPAISPQGFEKRIRETLDADGVSFDETKLRDMLATTDGSWRGALSVREDIIVASKRAA
jgi:replication factor C subunit 3/5